MRRDDAYWQRLRRDRRSNTAALFAVVASLSATLAIILVSIPGTHYQSRANALYWLLMVPMIWWVSGLIRFEARYVRLWRPALALASIASVVVAVMTMRATGTWTAQTVACAVTLAATVISLLIYRGSLVEREGSSR